MKFITITDDELRAKEFLVQEDKVRIAMNKYLGECPYDPRAAAIGLLRSAAYVIISLGVASNVDYEEIIDPFKRLFGRLLDDGAPQGVQDKMLKEFKEHMREKYGDGWEKPV